MKIVSTREMQEGANVTVHRLLLIDQGHLITDPFILWDDFSIPSDAGFPTHAHRGFEAITYLYDGAMNHADNLGNNETVTAGGAQRFTAGKGIQHSEMPDGSETTRGIQLWINLPKELKGIEPGYQQVDAEDIPESQLDGVILRYIVGNGSPLVLKTAIEYTDIQMNAGAKHGISPSSTMQGFLYVHEGEVAVNDETVQANMAALIHLEDDNVSLKATQNSRIMVVLGTPHNEPVKLNGGFVD